MASPRSNGTTRTKTKTVPRPKEELQRLTAEALCTVYLPTEEIPVPSLGGTVLIKAFSGRVARECRNAAEWRTAKARGQQEAVPGIMEEDDYEWALVKFGMVDPVLTDEQLDTLWEEQNSFIGRTIALAVLALNASGKSRSISKGSG